MAVMDLQARDKHHTAIKASHVTASASISFVTAASYSDNSCTNCTGDEITRSRTVRSQYWSLKHSGVSTLHRLNTVISRLITTHTTIMQWATQRLQHAIIK